jgi:hypothetical protein
MLIGTKHSGYSRANIRLYFDPITLMAAGSAIVPEVAALTAAEVIAAEAAAAAAAETLAAQQAAAAVAAETAAITAAEAGALQAAQQAAQSGIMQVGGTSAAPLTSEAVQTIAQQAGQNLAPETLTRGIQGIPEVMPDVANAPYQFSQAELDALTRGQEIARASSAAPPMEVTAGLNTTGTSLEGSILDKLNSPSTITDSMLRAGTNPAIPNNITDSMLRDSASRSFTPPVAAAPPVAPPAMPSAPPVVNPDLAAGPYMPEQAGPYPYATDAYNTPLPDTRSTLTKGLDSAMDWVKNNKFQAASGAFMGAKALGLLDPSEETFNDDPYDGSLSKYRMSPDFKGRTATPNIYRPTYPTYAAGGIMNADPVQSMSDQNDAMGYQQAMAATGGQVAHFAKGGNLSDSLDYYKSMMGGKQPKAPNDPSFVNSVGIARDDDPDTRSLDALTAAQIRNAKANKRANLSIPNMKRPTPMGQINLAAPGIKSSAKEDVQEAAAGGIMGASSLGGYAAGGNPRLLRGPGDGMSDNIPAMIGKKQPARLADGEFVIPADVVSHLGNGSTEAGAKRLHEMMNKVRRDRTGNSRQGKQIVASKYMPK